MIRRGDSGYQMGQLVLDRYDARLRVNAALKRAIAAAEGTAAVQERVAATMERLADLHPQDEARLRSMSTAARERAERRRRWAAGRAAAARDTITVTERDRIAALSQDEVVQRLFVAGLRLNAAAGLNLEPEVRLWIEAVADQLDSIVREVRRAVLAAGLHRHGLALEILDLAGRLAPTADIRVTCSPDGGMDPAASAGLPRRLPGMLALISEHATATRVDITADRGWCDVVVEATCLSPVTAAGGTLRWLADARASAARAGMVVDIYPESGRIRLSSRLRSAWDSARSAAEQGAPRSGQDTRATRQGTSASNQA